MQFDSELLHNIDNFTAVLKKRKILVQFLDKICGRDFTMSMRRGRPSNHIPARSLTLKTKEGVKWYKLGPKGQLKFQNNKAVVHRFEAYAVPDSPSHDEFNPISVTSSEPTPQLSPAAVVPHIIPMINFDEIKPVDIQGDDLLQPIELRSDWITEMPEEPPELASFDTLSSLDWNVLPSDRLELFDML